MSIEDDREHLAEQMRKAMVAVTAGQPDQLVFMLRGSEISARLIKMAETAEAEAAKLSEDNGNVRQLPRRHRPAALPMPPGYPEPSEESRREMNAILVRSYLSAATDYRFLASHVEEDRFFRLATHDLNSLGFVVGPMPMTSGGPFPIGR